MYYFVWALIFRKKCFKCQANLPETVIHSPLLLTIYCIRSFKLILVWVCVCMGECESSENSLNLRLHESFVLSQFF